MASNNIICENPNGELVLAINIIKDKEETIQIPINNQNSIVIEAQHALITRIQKIIGILVMKIIFLCVIISMIFIFLKK
jgi:hypothetical protein